MKRGGPWTEVNELRKYLTELERQFLARHLGQKQFGQPSRREILDVAAYVVLAHGALENFVEGVALWILDRSVGSWVRRKKVTRCNASLLLYQPVPEVGEPGDSVFDAIRRALDTAKESGSRRVRENNGVGPKHLKTLFHPLGIDIPKDPILTASLELVVALRHEWAHRYRFGARVIKSARDAQVAMADCVRYAEHLSTAAAKARP